VPQNPFWPRLRADWAPLGHIGYGSSWTSYEDMPWVDMTLRRLIEEWTTNRGRQYETNQQQSGTWSGTWSNTDGAMDPSNVNSPFSPNIVPYRALRLRAQWPGVVNLLTYDQATAGEGTPYPAGAVPPTMNVNSGASYAISLTAAGDAYQGTQVYQVAVPSGATSPKDLWDLTAVPVAPGTTYCAQINARMLSTVQNLNVHISINWLSSSGSTISTTVGSNVLLTGGSTTWTQITVSGTAPTGAVTATIRAVLGTTTTATATFQVDGAQWEQASVASPFTLPGIAPTNLLTVDLATSGEGTIYGPSAAPGMFGMDISGLAFTEWQVVSSATAWQGTQVVELTIASAGAGTLQFYTRVPVYAAQAYSYTIHARCMTTGQNPSAQAQISWRSATGALLSTTNGTASTLTGSPSASWSTLTVSDTAPAGAAYAFIGLYLPGAVSSSTQLQTDGLQWEANASPSAWVIPNTWFPIVTMGVERYPQSWTRSGTFGKSTPTAVDTFGLLSQSVLADPLTAALFTPSGGQAPSFAYTFGDPSSANSFADSTGNLAGAQTFNSKHGAGTITAGVAQTSANPAGAYLGSPGTTVVNITSSAAAGTDVYGQPMSWINLPNAKGVAGPGAGTGLNFTRMIAFRCTATPTNFSTLWTSQNASNINELSVGIFSGGAIAVSVNDANHTGSLTIGTLDLNNWHLAWLGVAADGNSFMCGIDNSISTVAATPTALTYAGGFSTDQVGATPVNFDAAGGVYNFKGDIAFLVEWPFVLSSAQVSAIYTAWRTSWSGQSSGQRYATILGLAGWTGPTVIDSGSSTSLGPIAGIAGQDALSALQAVVDTEAGNHYVDRSGRIVFTSRASRYNATTPVVTFGENTGAGEWPYEDLAYDMDPTLICNLARVTQQSTGQVFTAQDAGSQTNNGTRTRTITNLSTSAQECQDQATYVVSRYKTPAQRIKTLRLHPNVVPNLWPVALSLELGLRVRHNRRPPGGTQITTDGFIESINWSARGGNAYCDLRLSPADLTPYGAYAALHATLKNAANSGQATAVLNPLADSATNSFSCYVFSGMQFTFEPGTTNAETLTVQSVSSTAPGYTSVTITFTANLTKTHAIGTVICEALPSSSSTTYSINGASYTPPGPTDPTKWDTSAFGNVAFAY
jgi:hypothetical protein